MWKISRPGSHSTLYKPHSQLESSSLSWGRTEYTVSKRRDQTSSVYIVCVHVSVVLELFMSRHVMHKCEICRMRLLLDPVKVVIWWYQCYLKFHNSLHYRSRKTIFGQVYQTCCSPETGTIAIQLADGSVVTPDNEAIVKLPQPCSEMALCTMAGQVAVVCTL